MRQTSSLVFFLAALTLVGCDSGGTGGSNGSSSSSGSGGAGGAGGAGGSGGSAGGGGAGGADIFASCEGKNYVGTIHEPADGATNVAVNTQIRVEFTPTGFVPDRYLIIQDTAGNIPAYVTSGFEGNIEYSQFELAPNTQYDVEIGWMCVVNVGGATQSKNYVLDTASFTTAP